MPDENKFEMLRYIEYEIPVTCSMCKHGQFKPGQDWGTCGLHTYEHKKHTGDARGVSIHRSGMCPYSELNEKERAKLGAHAEFLPDSL